MKRIIARNLPISERYEIKRSYHTGGLENAQCCANCGRPIVEVAVVGDSQGNEHAVGMDCAETLSGVSSDFVFQTVHKAAFVDAKTFAAALRKARKLAPIGAVVVSRYEPNTGYFKQGGFTVEFGSMETPGHFWKNYPAHLYPYIAPIAGVELSKQEPAALQS